MSTVLVSHDAGLAHDMGDGHPERPERLHVVTEALARATFPTLRRIEAPEATRDMLVRAHSDVYVDALLAARPERGRLLRIDPDTAIGNGTLPAALRGAGGAVAAVDEVLAGRADNAFVAMRPPGHHAERATAMGFCFFNSAAVAARHARAVHGVDRVAILDWDVHHGNGTQDIFWDDPDVMYASCHQMPLFPGSGATAERGTHDTIVNAPLRAGDGSAAFREALDGRLLPRIRAFRPDLVIVSAGFDAHRRDPLGQIQLDDTDFYDATLRVMDVASSCCGGRLVSLLEGGYDLQGLRTSVAAHVRALVGRPAEP